MRHLLRRGQLWCTGGAAGVYTTRGEVPLATWMDSVTRRNGFVTITASTDALERDALELARDGAIFLITAGAPMPASHDWRQGATASTPSPADIAAAVAFAGEELVRLRLALAPPGRRVRLDPARLARHVLVNPPYAVLYAHAAAAAVLRWAGSPPGEFRSGRLTEPGELMLLDALSWLPERVASATRRGRPDVLARHLETVASRTIDIMSTRAYGPGQILDAERLWLILAARTGLAEGLRLLGITAPERL